jgi:hypothetical protein
MNDPRHVDISLTIPEFGQAIQTAWVRIVASSAIGLNHATTYTRSMIERFEQEVVGACGEIGVGKWIGKWFVPSVGTFHRVPDCLQDVEVRATRNFDGCLIVRGNDSPKRRFILALVDGLRVRLAGWILGAEARDPKWVADPHGHRSAWFVKQPGLRPMPTFNLAAGGGE